MYTSCSWSCLRKKKKCMNDIKQRESLYDISWQVDEPEYRKDPAYSYSTIARFHREGFEGLPKLFDKVESPSLLFGSLVDTLLTGSTEEFDNTFVVAEFPAIPDSQANVIKYIFNSFSNEYVSLRDVPDVAIINTTEVLDFQKNWKPETRAKVIKENGEEYYSLLHLATGKTLISTKDYQDAQECVNALKTSEYTREYFEPNNPFEDDIETFYQLKFKGTYKNIPLRCMADMIRVDHNKKTVLPIDLKTSFKKEWNFYESFIQWGYWIQAQLYWFIIRQNMDNHPLYKDYELLDYRFIVVSNYSRKPLVWEYKETKVETDCYYGNNPIAKIVCKNWRGIVEELHFYMTHKPPYPKGICDINDIIYWLNR